MTTQAEMFPKSKIDFAQEFAEHFQADVEAAEKALLRAQDRLTEATRLRDDAEENLRRELDMAQGGTETAVSRDSVPSEAQEPHGAGSGPDAAAGVDPITGEVEEDELLARAIKTVIDTGAAGVALLQRRLSIGYGRAAAIIDRMEMIGVVSGATEGSKARTVILDESDIAKVLAECEAA